MNNNTERVGNKIIDTIYKILPDAGVIAVAILAGIGAAASVPSILEWLSRSN